MTTESTQTNPFDDADPWTVSTDNWLGVGNFIVKIVYAEDATAKTSGNPQIALKFENEQGAKLDWCAYSGDFLARVVSLFDAAEVQRPQPGEFDPNDNYRLTQACIDRLVGKTIGIVNREEPDYKDPTVMRVRVQGYTTASAIGQ